MSHPTAGPSRRLFAAACAALAAAALPLGAARAQAAGKPNRVVLQVSDADPQKWTLALSNAYNVQNGVGADGVELEIVVYGPGIGMLRNGSPVADRVASAMKSGIAVVACENTMTAQKLTKRDMLPDIGYVPAGVVELMKRQQQGWAYIRP
ncbi:DsrE family protein [Ramlibacter sp.]|uniref:DsrE family protein n=1 Tax=Ramlibacter sp. TaxID=1917967 RepID=UPI002BEFD23A|nr:DsrE family protein [Ramlibacter sp.]HWI82830.1 DsrE family protein [Ramlibacter sp.]